MGTLVHVMFWGGGEKKVVFFPSGCSHLEPEQGLICCQVCQCWACKIISVMSYIPANFLLCCMLLLLLFWLFTVRFDFGLMLDLLSHIFLSLIQMNFFVCVLLGCCVKPFTEVYSLITIISVVSLSTLTVPPFRFSLLKKGQWMQSCLYSHVPPPLFLLLLLFTVRECVCHSSCLTEV